MSRYTAYGLLIESELPLPELRPDGQLADVSIRRGSIQLPAGGPAGDRQRWVRDGVVYLSCRRRGALRIAAGSEILVSPAPGADERIIRNWVLGQGLGIIMHQRGFLVLHASAVEFEKSAVVFVGGSGSGKSTLALAMCRQGHGVLSDDYAVISTAPDPPLVQGGFPQLKLRPDSLAGLGAASPQSTGHRVSEEKLGWNIQAQFAAGPLPLRAVYVLRSGDAAGIVEIPAGAAPAELARHSFLAASLSASEVSADWLGRCAELAAKVRVAMLQRPTQFDGLPDLVRLTKGDLERHTEETTPGGVRPRRAAPAGVRTHSRPEPESVPD
ncbi:MAG: hypothetical protein ABSD27_12120 [Bryobacteraceae bacterium]|jgi:hypothetical protein